jgi:hypothetical protein
MSMMVLSTVTSAANHPIGLAGGNDISSAPHHSALLRIILRVKLERVLLVERSLVKPCVPRLLIAPVRSRSILAELEARIGATTLAMVLTHRNGRQVR